jgi:hypothetical protein
MKKYEKPLMRGLSDVSIAFGSQCISGSRPLQACIDGGGNVGPCEVGDTAGRPCATGGLPDVPTPCTPGTTVTFCTNGSKAATYKPGG